MPGPPKRESTRAERSQARAGRQHEWSVFSALAVTLDESPASDMTDVTVVIPTRDRHELLAAHALPSALGQKGVSVEVIVVDDGSARPVAEAPGVRVIRHAQSRGIAAARNAGIFSAAAAWVAFLDDDDLWAPAYLKSILDAAGDAAWAYAAGIIIDGSYAVIGELKAPDPVRVERGAEARQRRRRRIAGRRAKRALPAPGRLRRVALLRRGLGPVAAPTHHARAAALHEALVATLDHPQRALFRDPDAVARGIERLLSKRRHGATDKRQPSGSPVSTFTSEAPGRGSPVRARSAPFSIPGNAATASERCSGTPACVLRRDSCGHRTSSTSACAAEPAWLAERSRGQPPDSPASPNAMAKAGSDEPVNNATSPGAVGTPMRPGRGAPRRPTAARASS